MSDIEKYLQSKGLSKATVKYYNAEILKFITWCDMQNVEPEQISSTDITAYLKYLNDKGQESLTKSIQLIILKHYFSYQISKGERESNPAKNIKIRGAKTHTLYPIFSKAELESIYHSYEVPKANDSRNKRNWFTSSRLSRQRNKAVLSLMIYQGLCTDEINRLSLSDVRLKEGTIYIVGSRSSEERTMELRSHQIMELMEYQLSTREELLKLTQRESELYFITSLPRSKSSAGNMQLSIDTVYIWKGLSKEIKQQHPKFSNFRQVRTSVITHWLKQYNLRQVQYMAGHRYISSTEHYLVNQTEDLQNDIDKFHPLG